LKFNANEIPFKINGNMFWIKFREIILLLKKTLQKREIF